MVAAPAGTVWLLTHHIDEVCSPSLGQGFKVNTINKFNLTKTAFIRPIQLLQKITTA